MSLHNLKEGQNYMLRYHGSAAMQECVCTSVTEEDAVVQVDQFDYLHILDTSDVTVERGVIVFRQSVF